MYMKIRRGVDFIVSFFPPSKNDSGLLENLVVGVSRLSSPHLSLNDFAGARINLYKSQYTQHLQVVQYTRLLCFCLYNWQFYSNTIKARVYPFQVHPSSYHGSHLHCNHHRASSYHQVHVASSYRHHPSSCHGSSLILLVISVD